MLRFILLSILLTFLFRAVTRLWAGIVRGMQDGSGRTTARTSARSASRSVQMSRDPICGTFVVPEKAVAVSGTNGERFYFCSAACRDEFMAARNVPLSAPGRTA